MWVIRMRSVVGAVTQADTIRISWTSTGSFSLPFEEQNNEDRHWRDAPTNTFKILWTTTSTSTTAITTSTAATMMITVTTTMMMMTMTMMTATRDFLSTTTTTTTTTTHFSSSPIQRQVETIQNNKTTKCFNISSLHDRVLLDPVLRSINKASKNHHTLSIVTTASEAASVSPTVPIHTIPRTNPSG